MSASANSPCPICAAAAVPYCEGTVLGKYRAGYYRCPNCALIFIPNPTWLEEAYSSAITRTDVGLVRRNVELSEVICALAYASLKEKQSALTCLDYGAGYGLLVRLLRDRGIECQGYDRYCEPIFSSAFCTREIQKNRYDFVTAVEVAEHLVTPHDLFGLLNTITDTVIFTTMLQPTEAPQPDNWWYYCLEHGQHVALYHRRTLEHIARRYGANLFSDGSSFHIITRRRLNATWVRLWMRYRYALVYNWVTGRRRFALTEKDAEQERARSAKSTSS